MITEQIAGAPARIPAQPAKWPFSRSFGKTWRAALHAVRSARALIVRNQTQVTVELIRAAERLEVIARAGVGLDNVDVAGRSRAGVVVAFTPSQNSISVAELTLGLMLGLARKIAAADRHVKQGGWARYQFVGSELYGKTLGVVGLGRIGCLTARRAAAFGMDIVTYDPFLDPDAPMVAELRPRIVDLDELLAVADIVSCHLPCNVETRASSIMPVSAA